MNPLNLASAAVSKVRRDGMYGLMESVARKSVSRGLGSVGLFRGESAFKDEWDVLVVLDACRHDAMRQVAPEYEFLPDSVPCRCSVGSSSDRWMERTFTPDYREETSKTAYITGNANSEKSLQNDSLLRVDELWKTAFNSDLGTVPPRPITDRAISLHRAGEADRMVLHYMQPHFPSIPDPLGFGIQNGAPNPDEHTWIWTGADQPEGLSRERIWTAYIENLRYVLEDVQLLLENIDAEKVIITADHGNAYGEWGLWGHPHFAVPVLRRVPWVETHAVDERTRVPESGEVHEVPNTAAEQLRALGYR